MFFEELKNNLSNKLKKKINALTTTDVLTTLDLKKIYLNLKIMALYESKVPFIE